MEQILGALPLPASEFGRGRSRWWRGSRCGGTRRGRCWTSGLLRLFVFPTFAALRWVDSLHQLGQFLQHLSFFNVLELGGFGILVLFILFAIVVVLKHSIQLVFRHGGERLAHAANCFTNPRENWELLLS